MDTFNLSNVDILDNLHEGVYILNNERRITYWNKGAEDISGYSSIETVGKFCSDNILVHVDGDGVKLCKEGCPAAMTLNDGNIHEAEVFLHHKKGHRVPVIIRMLPIKDLDGNVMGAAELFTDNTSNFLKSEKIKELVRYSFIDPITGLVNRRYGEMKINSMLQEYKQKDERLNVLMIEITNLKGMNEKFGNEVTDNVMKSIANTLSNNTRPDDIVSKWGSGRFLVIVPKMKKGVFLLIANKLKVLVEQSFIETKDGIAVVDIIAGGTNSNSIDNFNLIMKRIEDIIISLKNEGKSNFKME